MHRDDDKFSVRKGSLSHIHVRHSDANKFCKLDLFHFAKLFKHFKKLGNFAFPGPCWFPSHDCHYLSEMEVE